MKESRFSAFVARTVNFADRLSVRHEAIALPNGSESANGNGHNRLPRSLVASAAPITASNVDKNLRLKDSEWQVEAWRFYDLIGELRFAANWIGGALSQCRMYVGELDDSGEVTKEVKTGDIAKLAAVPLGSGSRRDENLRLLGINLFVAGEAFIIGEGVRTDDETDKWYVVSNAMIDTTGGKIIVNRPRDVGGGKLVLRDDRDIMRRVWTPHPRFTDQPDSPVRAAIPVLTEMLLLLKREFAELESRLVGAGIQWLPEGIDFPHGDDEEGGLGGFVKYLARVAEQNMGEQADASAMLPIFATLPDWAVEFIDKLKPTHYWSELSEKLGELKSGAIQRLALALDMPAELLTGAADSSRWHAWLADEQVIKIHIRPLLSRVADAATIGYLVAALEDIEEDPKAYAYGFDTAPLAVRPNRSEDALAFWDRGLVDDETARKEGAFPDEAKMTEVERIRHLVMRAAEREPSLLADPTIRRIIGIEGEIGGTSDQDGRPREIEPPPAENPRALPSGEDEGRERNASVNSKVPSVDLVMTASNLMVLRAMELAGGRMTSPGDRRHRWSEVPKYLLNIKVGPQTDEQAEKLLAGAWDHIGVLATGFGLRESELRRLLHGYCVTLLTSGTAHSDDLLAATVNDAMRPIELVA